MQQALSLLNEGRGAEAEEILLACVEETQERFGRHSPAHADASNELGTVLLNLGQKERAIEAFREACAGPAPTGELLRDHLTFLMNLGTTLEENGELAEAEAVLRRGLEARRALYGAEHAGHAFGLEPLARVLLARGHAAEALAMLEETVENFWNNGHPRVAGALVLRAEALTATGAPSPLFPEAEALPEALVVGLAEAALARVDEAPLLTSRRVLAELAPVLAERLGETHDATREILVATANVERRLGDAGDLRIRRAAIRRSISIAERLGDGRRAVSGSLALALTFDPRREAEEMVASFREALECARRFDLPSTLSEVHRNLGLALAEASRRGEAEAELRAAVSSAEDDSVARGRAEIALGLFLQHGGDAVAARPLIAAGMARLGPADPDALCGRAHLHALEANAEACCGDAEWSSAVCEAFAAFALERVPPGVLTSLSVRLHDAAFELDVQLAREPSPEELERLDRALQLARSEFGEHLAARA